jgi:hypothetical protein
MGTDGIFRRKDGVYQQTTEGRTGVIEAIKFIKEQPPVPELRWNLHMWMSCRDHAEE